MKTPLVSICCLTYNHENYIAECLDGFIMQKTDFDYEILIHDDASTDGTAGIIREYELRYPEIIKPIYQIENQYSKGIKPTFKYNFPRARGKYIALCEGDDYWTDPFKLQKQVDFLEANEDCSVVCHDAIVVNSEGHQIEDSAYTHPDHKRDFTADELMRCTGNVLTLTRCFRNVIPFFPPELKGVFFGDTVLASLLGQYGYSKYLPEKMAAYRQSGTGVYSGAKISDRLGNSIRTYIQLSKYYKRLRNKKLAKHFLVAAQLQNRQHIYYSVEENNKKQLIMALKDNFFLAKSHPDKLSFIILLKVFIKKAVLSRK